MYTSSWNSNINLVMDLSLKEQKNLRKPRENREEYIRGDREKGYTNATHVVKQPLFKLAVSG